MHPFRQVLIASLACVSFSCSQEPIEPRQSNAIDADRVAQEVSGRGSVAEVAGPADLAKGDVVIRNRAFEAVVDVTAEGLKAHVVHPSGGDRSDERYTASLRFTEAFKKLDHDVRLVYWTLGKEAELLLILESSAFSGLVACHLGADDAEEGKVKWLESESLIGDEELLRDIVQVQRATDSDSNVGASLVALDGEGRLGLITLGDTPAVKHPLQTIVGAKSFFLTYPDPGDGIVSVVVHGYEESNVLQVLRFDEELELRQRLVPDPKGGLMVGLVHPK